MANNYIPATTIEQIIKRYTFNEIKMMKCVDREYDIVLNFENKIPIENGTITTIPNSLMFNYMIWRSDLFHNEIVEGIIYNSDAIERLPHRVIFQDISIAEDK